MHLRDYDAEFKEYLENWLAQNRANYKKVEEIEDAVPGLYADWLEGAMRELEKLSGPQLAEMMLAYNESGQSVPDVLYTALTLRDDAEKAVNGMRKTAGSEAFSILLVNLLSEMESTLPLPEYMAELAAAQEDSPYLNAVAEAVALMGKEAGPAIMEAYGKAKTVIGRELLLNAAATADVNENMAPALCTLFYQTENKAFVAGLMARRGDDKCLKLLEIAQYSPEVDYIAYVEICNAIEALGGETLRDRVFESDKSYEYMAEKGE